MSAIDTLRTGIKFLMMSMGISSPAKKPRPAPKPATKPESTE
jgi:hypothetical protein